jgi:hypothetical protein
MASLSKAGFLALSDHLDRASEVQYHAKAALDNHLRQHGCMAEAEESAGAGGHEVVGILSG